MTGDGMSQLARDAVGKLLNRNNGDPDDRQRR